MRKREIFLINLCIHRLLDRFRRGSSKRSRKEKIVPHYCHDKQCDSKKFRNRYYINTIMTKFIDMNFRNDKKPKYEHHKYGIYTKAKPEHITKNYKLKTSKSLLSHFQKNDFLSPSSSLIDDRVYPHLEDRREILLSPLQGKYYSDSL